MAPANQPPDIDQRALEFASQVLFFVRTITREPGNRAVIEQLVDAAGSIGANRQESSGASSRKEFKRFNEISLRGAKESVFWLRVCDRVGLGDARQRAALLDEAIQIKRILTSIVLSITKGKKPQT